MAKNKAPTKHLKKNLKTLKLSVMCMSILQYIKGPPALPVPPLWSETSKTSFFNRVCVAWISIPAVCVFMHFPIVRFCPIYLIHMLCILFKVTFLIVGYCWVMVNSFCVTISDNLEILPPCVARKDTVKGSMGPIESGPTPPSRLYRLIF